MREYMPFVTVEIWQLIFTWINLFILYLLMKKFLFRPVKTMMKQREKEIKDIYKKADETQKDAEELKKKYDIRLEEAEDEARKMRKEASLKAHLRSEKIVGTAEENAAEMIEKAEKLIEAEKKEAVNEIKNDISSMVLTIASKVIEKEIKEENHRELIEKFIEELGDAS